MCDFIGCHLFSYLCGFKNTAVTQDGMIMVYHSNIIVTLDFLHCQAPRKEEILIREGHTLEGIWYISMLGTVHYFILRGR